MMYSDFINEQMYDHEISLLNRLTQVKNSNTNKQLSCQEKATLH